MCCLGKIIRTKGDFGKIKSSNLVFTNGCFDLLHPGHLQYLSKAKNLGGLLVVGLNSDDSIKRIKGLNRPINNFEFRAKMLAYFSFVDFIVEFDDETPINLIKQIRPNILVKGADYKNQEVVGSDVVLSYGGKVVLLEFLEGYSSSSIIDKIIFRY
jgi:rfaE bifunctional protein nucleotidyltransferase chain/domain